MTRKGFTSVAEQWAGNLMLKNEDRISKRHETKHKCEWLGAIGQGKSFYGAPKIKPMTT